MTLKYRSLLDPEAVDAIDGAIHSARKRFPGSFFLKTLRWELASAPISDFVTPTKSIDVQLPSSGMAPRLEVNAAAVAAYSIAEKSPLTSDRLAAQVNVCLAHVLCEETIFWTRNGAIELFGPQVNEIQQRYERLHNLTTPFRPSFVQPRQPGRVSASDGGTMTLETTFQMFSVVNQIRDSFRRASLHNASYSDLRSRLDPSLIEDIAQWLESHETRGSRNKFQKTIASSLVMHTNNGLDRHELVLDYWTNEVAYPFEKGQLPDPESTPESFFVEREHFIHRSALRSAADSGAEGIAL